MSKKSLLVVITLCSMISASTQTLFTYGKYSANAKDFLKAYNKNNVSPVSNKSKAIHDYLDLYINSKLKIQEAYAKKYDTLSQVKNEVDNLRAQIVENYMSDPATLDRLNNEAFQRSLKNIHAAHIFISFKNADGVIDTVAAKQKRDEIIKRLQKGDDFLLVAQQNSDDPSANINKGDMGFISVFTLPYEFENIIYTTPVGRYSAPYRSGIGYHIFKNIAERKALGKIKAKQILLAMPPGSDDAVKLELKNRADSLYNVIMAGGDFSKLATEFSNDYISAASRGDLPEIRPGRYDEAFEKALWSLPKDSAVSKPFYTNYGWHILKRISLIPVITDPDNKANMKEIQEEITYDNRWKTSTDFIYDRVIKKVGYKKLYEDPILWAISDSLLDSKNIGIGKTMNRNSSVFKIGDTTIKVYDWIAFAESNRYIPGAKNTKPYDRMMVDFVHTIMINYYREHLEDFNEDFRSQMDEFRDGNMFFEIMQQEVWNKAQNDSVELQAFYEKNKKNYTWKQSADAVVFFCSDQDVAKKVFEEIKKNPTDWRRISEQESEKVVADSTRYDWDQIPGLNKITPGAGMITTMQANNNDNTASFAYIIQVFPQSMQRSFAEAKGLVINDYQAVLEQKWTAELKKKYPVVINQKVLASISK